MYLVFYFIFLYSLETSIRLTHDNIRAVCLKNWFNIKDENEFQIYHLTLILRHK